ncbi:hypothetical protein CIB84_008960, partial [Bambusicola thoracicus]
PPVITTEPAGITVEAGATAMLNCQASGEPPPAIRWFRQGHPFVSNDRMTVLSNGSLHIIAAQKEDTSEYECVAKNLMGSVLVRVPLTVQVNGNWGPWQTWSQCSASCGGGEQTRTRLCSNPAPLYDGHPCPGDSSQISRCNSQACPGGPSRALGSIIGNINDIEFGIASLNATVTDSPNSESRVIHANITSIPRSLGEVLRMTHIARGLDSDGALLLDVVVNGHVLQLQPRTNVNMKDYTEDYIQTGPGQLYAHSTRLFAVDGVSVPYTWNHTITYGHTKGKMPFLVETLHASSITTEYNPLEETLAFKIHASISKVPMDDLSLPLLTLTPSMSSSFG